MCQYHSDIKLRHSDIGSERIHRFYKIATVRRSGPLTSGIITTRNALQLSFCRQLAFEFLDLTILLLQFLLLSLDDRLIRQVYAPGDILVIE